MQSQVQVKTYTSPEELYKEKWGLYEKWAKKFAKTDTIAEDAAAWAFSKALERINKNGSLDFNHHWSKMLVYRYCKRLNRVLWREKSVGGHEGLDEALDYAEETKTGRRIGQVTNDSINDDSSY